jgi:hypothetical protein
MSEVVQENLDIESARAFVKPPSKSVDLLADIVAEGGGGEGIPRLGEQVGEPLSPDAVPPCPPLGQKHV